MVDNRGKGDEGLQGENMGRMVLGGDMETRIDALLDELGVASGPWSYSGRGQHWNNPDLTRIEINHGTDGECVADTVYEKADARLIAQSREMVKALMENTLHTEECGAGWDHYRNIEIIESALGLSWDEIRERLEGAG
jgi:hypothetical protein